MWLAVTVRTAGAMAKARVTSGAGRYVASPAWWAVILHVPVPVMVTVDPLTEQGPPMPALKVGVRPEEAVALTVNGTAP